MPDRPPPSSPPSSRDLGGDDFVFHLARGSELLRDDRVHDAKLEIERALATQPSDWKGQDLLGVVYFRLGLYPRAIRIYEELVRRHPGALEPRLNLALCYLKTAQAAEARNELERVVEAQPSHARAWRYLGLAYQRLGDPERAAHAFAAGGQEALAKRLLESTTQLTPLAVESLRPGLMGARGELSRAVREAEHDVARDSLLDVTELPPSLELAASSASEPGRMGTSQTGISGELSAVRPDSSERDELFALRAPRTPALPPPDEPPASEAEPVAPPPSPGAFLSRELLVFPRDAVASAHASGRVLVKSRGAFAVRLDHVSALAWSREPSVRPLFRATRGREQGEPLGGVTSPLVELEGKGELVLRAPAGRRLEVVALRREPLCAREDVVVGFEHTVLRDSGRLPIGEGESFPVVLLRVEDDEGCVVLSLPTAAGGAHALEVTTDRTLYVPSTSILAWVGRLAPRALAPSETPWLPGSIRGMTALEGEGLVLVDAGA